MKAFRSGLKSNSSTVIISSARPYLNKLLLLTSPSPEYFSSDAVYFTTELDLSSSNSPKDLSASLQAEITQPSSLNVPPLLSQSKKPPSSTASHAASSTSDTDCDPNTS